MNHGSSGQASTCSHDLADPFVRATWFEYIGDQRVPSLGCALALYNCTGCGTTLSLPLPGHVTADDEWAETTAVLVSDDLPLPSRRVEPVADRPGYVAVGGGL